MRNVHSLFVALVITILIFFILVIILFVIIVTRTSVVTLFVLILIGATWLGHCSTIVALLAVL